MPNAIDTLREAVDIEGEACGCQFCQDKRAALADVEALLQAAEAEVAVHELMPAYAWPEGVALAAAVRAVKGEPDA